MNGRELLAALRERRPQLPALIVSGYPGNDLVALPRTRVLLKPIRLVQLVEHLEALQREG